MSSCTAYRSSPVAARCGAGVEQQALLQRGQRQDIGDAVAVAASSSICCWLSRAGAMSDGVSPPPPPLHMRADPGQGVEPQLAQPARPARRRAPTAPTSSWRAAAGRPSVSMVPALSSTVCPSGIGTAAAARGDRQAVLADPPQVTGESSAAPRAQPPQVVEPDRRVGCVELDVGVQVAQQPVGQAVGQGAQLLFGVLDHRPQRGLAGDHLRPGQPPDDQRHRVLGGEPARPCATSPRRRPAPRGGRGPRRRYRSARRRCPRTRPRPIRTRSTECLAPQRETPRAPHPTAAGWSRRPAPPTAAPHVA